MKLGRFCNSDATHPYDISMVWYVYGFCKDGGLARGLLLLDLDSFRYESEDFLASFRSKEESGVDDATHSGCRYGCLGEVSRRHYFCVARLWADMLEKRTEGLAFLSCCFFFSRSHFCIMTCDGRCLISELIYISYRLHPPPLFLSFCLSMAFSLFFHLRLRTCNRSFSSADDGKRRGGREA